MSKDPVIQVKNLRKSYRNGQIEVPVLRGLDLSVERGEFLAVIGPSGSGKSTLFNILGGLAPPTSGEVLIDGEDLRQMTENQRTELRQRKVGFIFQKYNLLPTLTAADNIAIARSLANLTQDPPEFKNLLQSLGIQSRMNHKPSALSGENNSGSPSPVRWSPSRAILLADEPTGNLDTENSIAVLNILQNLNRSNGQTILMITHNPEAAAYAQRTVRMRDGQMVPV